ncbi:lipoprotein 17-related variable surface protein [Mycoplasmopsis agassizii]|uniref:Lipoprotein-associated type-17 domain-containing protein n=1 Tax=Mycoplasmopsis agassizii TaxID=33922 RepID=A0ABX4H685_9BACT|nr:lipoprotein 17-related variable surface protein [Mycoplasmopsis agassizii]PAF55358.1 hypothetical protein CJF60_01560 [Mycoplasmopsis agassizii]SMC15848.1 Lipoprotein associated domain-containing protein [Mycoplasmopsis agassizii]
MKSQKNVNSATYNAKNTYKDIDALNTALGNIKSFDDLEKILDTASAKRIKETLGASTFKANNGAVKDGSKVILRLDISYLQADASAKIEVNVNFVALDSTVFEPKTDKQLAKEWYDSVLSTNTASTNTRNSLPSAITSVNAETLATPLPDLPAGFTSHVKLVTNSADDLTGSLKVKVSLSKATTWFNVDGTSTTNENSAITKEVTVSGFKNTATTNSQKAIAYYRSLSQTYKLNNEEVKQNFATSVTQEILNTLVSFAPVAPSGLTVSLLLENNSANDKTGNLSVRVVLEEAPNKFFKEDGSEVNTKNEAGKVITISGFKVIEATSSNNPVKLWFDSLASVKTYESENKVLPSTINEQDLETTFSSLFRAPSAVENSKIVLTLVSKNDDKGTIVVKVALKAVDLWYSLEGNLQAQEASKEVKISGFLTTSEVVKKIYKNQSSTISVSSTKSAKETAENLVENVKTYFTSLQAEVDKVPSLGLTLRISLVDNAINNPEGILVVNFHLSREVNGVKQYFKQGGQIVPTLAEAIGKNVTLSGYKKVLLIDELAKDINNWKVKEDITLSEIRELRKIKNTNIDSKEVFNLLTKFASKETPILTSSENYEFVSTTKLITLDIQETSVNALFKGVLRNKNNHNETQEVTFKTDFAGFLPSFLTVTGNLKSDLSNKFIWTVFKELEGSNTFEKWASFVRPFAHSNKDNEQKLLNFSNSMGDVVNSKSEHGLQRYNLFYPFNPTHLSLTENPVEIIVILSNANVPPAWIGANSRTLVIGGLQNYKKDSTTIARGEPWKFNLIDGTKSATFIKYKNSEFNITLTEEFTPSYGYWKGFAANSAYTVKYKRDINKSPFVNGVSAATMLLLKAIINYQ